MQELEEASLPGQQIQPTTQLFATQPAAESGKRWRPKVVGEFDGTGDVHAFIERIRSVADQKGYRLLQARLVSPLKEITKDGRKSSEYIGFYYDRDSDYLDLPLDATSLDPWCLALVGRIIQSHSEPTTQSESSQSSRGRGGNSNNATGFMQEAMRVTKSIKWTQQDGIMTSSHHFDSSLHQTLNQSSSLNAFVQQLEQRQEGWFQIYARFASFKR